jgi:hypothetical protein
MNSFPELIRVENKNNFKSIYRDLILTLLRRDICLHILNNDENSFFDIEQFIKRYFDESKDDISHFLDQMINELNELGWKCQISYGGTALFIYSGEKPPPSCW